MKSSTSVVSSPADKHKVEDSVDCELISIFYEKVERQKQEAAQKRVL